MEVTSPNKTTDEYLKEVLKRCEAATPGPWQGVVNDEYNGIHAPDLDHTLFEATKGLHENISGNMPFIAHSREDLPRLARYCLKLRDALSCIVFDEEIPMIGKSYWIDEHELRAAKEAYNMKLEDLE